MILIGSGEDPEAIIARVLSREMAGAGLAPEVPTVAARRIVGALYAAGLQILPAELVGDDEEA